MTQVLWVWQVFQAASSLVSIYLGCLEAPTGNVTAAMLQASTSTSILVTGHHSQTLSGYITPLVVHGVGYSFLELSVTQTGS